MQRERLSLQLLTELYDLEEDAYRLSFHEAKHVGSPPGVALRAVLAHANETLEELPRMARERGVRLRSTRRLAFDTLRRARDLAMNHILDQEHSYRRALTAVHRGVDLVRLVHAAAVDEGDGSLARWCQRWLAARESLVAYASDELGWFGRHPAFARQPSALLLPGTMLHV